MTSLIRTARQHLPQSWRRCGWLIDETRRGERELALLPGLLGPGGTLVDIGANVGAYSLLAAAFGHHVLAFEPHPDVAEQLRNRLGARGIVHQFALSDRVDQHVALHVPQLHGLEATSRSSLRANNIDQPGRVLTVATRTVDDLHIDAASLIKIDVEGAEWEVLQGAEATLRRLQPNLLIEIEERHAAGNIARIREFLEDLGYHGWFQDTRWRPITEFDEAMHQNPAQQPQFGTPGHAGYVNNFVWYPTGVQPAQPLHPWELSGRLILRCLTGRF